jgi:uncharacterized cupin superfamily protein
MTDLTIKKADASQAPLPEMPIEPSWIVEGSPEARGTVLLQSEDKLVSSGLWSCTAGRFRWEFGWDEFVHILEGEATITEEGGNTCTLRPGDSAHFPLGLKTQWHVPEFVKKTFTIRTPEAFNLG